MQGAIVSSTLALPSARPRPPMWTDWGRVVRFPHPGLPPYRSRGQVSSRSPLNPCREQEPPPPNWAPPLLTKTSAWAPAISASGYVGPGAADRPCACVCFKVKSPGFQMTEGTSNTASLRDTLRPARTGAACVDCLGKTRRSKSQRPWKGEVGMGRPRNSSTVAGRPGRPAS